MAGRAVPQPGLERMVPFPGHPLVVGVVPGQNPLVVRTAVGLAAALGVGLYAGYVDTSRYTVSEHPDGSVTHAALDPDTADDSWRDTEAELRDHLATLLAGDGVPWQLRYLAGRPDRALTHLARAVDASALVVGTRAPGGGPRMRELLEGSVAAHLAHHQHRPVLTVPLAVVDWKEIRTPWER
ncbi:universal stress protein [Salana multivorans]